jgi:hypothetical protein
VCAADNISKQNGKFYIFSHTQLSLRPRTSLSAFQC